LFRPLDRTIASGSTHIKTDDGELHRKPILYRFGPEYGPMFGAANRRAAAARGRSLAASGTQMPEHARRAPTADFRASHPTLGSQGAPASSSPRPSSPSVPSLKGPKATGESESSVPMGPFVQESGLPAPAFDPDPHLEAALARLEEGFRQSRGGSGTDSAKRDS
jgi:hypothetical protein